MIRLSLFLVAVWSVSASAQEAPASQPATTPVEIPQLIDVRGESLSAIQQSIETIARNSSPDENTRQREETREGEALDIAGRDLTQQTRMADATEWIKIFTGLGFLISCVGLWMIGRTLKYTKDAAGTTKDTLQEVRTNAKAELRAYVSV